jgi:hypothetical protein
VFPPAALCGVPPAATLALHMPFGTWLELPLFPSWAPPAIPLPMPNRISGPGRSLAVVVRTFTSLGASLVTPLDIISSNTIWTLLLSTWN